MLGFAKRPQWRTVVGGSRTYVDAVTRPWRHRLRLETPIAGIERDEDGVSVMPRGREPERFDHVVLATHSDQALALLRDATDREHEILGAIPCQPNEAVLHTDRNLLPRRRRAWASWNYHLLPEPTGMTTVTYHMNRLQALEADRELCVTLNRSEAIDPSKVLRTIAYAHPVFTPAAHRHSSATTRSADRTARTSAARTGTGASTLRIAAGDRRRPRSPRLGRATTRRQGDGRGLRRRLVGTRPTSPPLSRSPRAT